MWSIYIYQLFSCLVQSSNYITLFRQYLTLGFRRVPKNRVSNECVSVYDQSSLFVVMHPPLDVETLHLSLNKSKYVLCMDARRVMCNLKKLKKVETRKYDIIKFLIILPFFLTACLYKREISWRTGVTCNPGETRIKNRTVNSPNTIQSRSKKHQF